MQLLQQSVAAELYCTNHASSSPKTCSSSALTLVLLKIYNLLLQMLPLVLMQVAQATHFLMISKVDLQCPAFYLDSPQGVACTIRVSIGQDSRAV